MLDYMSIPDFQYEKALINACRIISDAKVALFFKSAKFPKESLWMVVSMI